MSVNRDLRNGFCRDHVEYAVLAGVLINSLFVRRDVETIFRYRQEILNKLFA